MHKSYTPENFKQKSIRNVPKKEPAFYLNSGEHVLVNLEYIKNFGIASTGLETTPRKKIITEIPFDGDLLDYSGYDNHAQIGTGAGTETYVESEGRLVLKCTSDNPVIWNLNIPQTQYINNCRIELDFFRLNINSPVAVNFIDGERAGLFIQKEGDMIMFGIKNQRKGVSLLSNDSIPANKWYKLILQKKGLNNYHAVLDLETGEFICEFEENDVPEITPVEIHSQEIFLEKDNSRASYLDGYLRNLKIYSI